MKRLVCHRILRLSLLVCHSFIIVLTGNFGVEHGENIKEGFINKQRRTSSALQCSYQCFRAVYCMSASYNSDEGFCHLSMRQIIGPADEGELLQAVESSWSTVFYKDCLKGWQKVEERCFMVSQNSKNYGEAQINCEQNGGKLAEPLTNATFELLRIFLTNNYDINGLWFGLNDMEEEGNFVWTTSGGVPLYTAWAIDQPNNWQNEQHCGCLGCDSDGYKWNDYYCNSRMRFLCEM